MGLLGYRDLHHGNGISFLFWDGKSSQYWARGLVLGDLGYYGGYILCPRRTLLRNNKKNKDILGIFGVLSLLKVEFGGEDGVFVVMWLLLMTRGVGIGGREAISGACAA